MRLPASPGGRFAVWTVALLGGVALLLMLVDRLTPTPTGPASSSYATTPKGVGAYAELLEAAGHRVTRLRRPVARRAPGSGSTLIVLDARDVPPEEAIAIGEFVEGGGRLVVAGHEDLEWLQVALGPAPRAIADEPLVARPIGSEPETEQVREVRAPQGGELTELGDADAILGSSGAGLGADGAVFAAAQDAGDGRIVVLGDVSPLQNRALDQADNAAFALALAGPEDRPVAFLETVHGYGATGLAALPGSAKAGLALLALALVAFAWSRARRIGPVERGEDEELPPARAVYVDALAATLERTRRPEAVGERLAAEARARLARRATLDGSASDEVLREAAARFGLPEDEARAVVDGVDGPEGALAAGRALARLSEREAVS